MVVTIVIPISRPDFLKRIFAQLDSMPCDNGNTNLLCYVDGDEPLFEIARNFVVNSKFKDKLCVFRRKGLPNVNHIHSRRQRIADIHNEIKNIIGKCDYLLLLEDDTLIPLNTLDKFLKLSTIYPHAGLISGVQIGRWGFNVPGIWKVDNPYDVKKINSMLPPESNMNQSNDRVEEIDAAGLYCCLTKPEFYKSCTFAPFESILGPDVFYGIYLRKQGYKNYVDWSIQTGHLTKQGDIKVYNTQLQQITFTKIDAEKWEQEVI